MKLTAATTGTADVRRALKRLGAAPAQALALTVEQVESFVEGEVGKHSKTGALFSSVSKRRTPGGWFVFNDGQVASYARWVHWGARPHIILPKNKKILRFPVGARFRFAKKVKHPGYRGDPWYVRAAAMAPAAFDRHVKAMLAQRGG